MSVGEGIGGGEGEEDSEGTGGRGRGGERQCCNESRNGDVPLEEVDKGKDGDGQG